MAAVCLCFFSQQRVFFLPKPGPLVCDLLCLRCGCVARRRWILLHLLAPWVAL